MERKKNAGWDGTGGTKPQPSGASQSAPILHSWLMPPFQSTRASRSAQAEWACQGSSSLASACPRSRSFSLKWQQWAYPVLGQCWSLWDAGCYSKTCTLD